MFNFCQKVSDDGHLNLAMPIMLIFGRVEFGMMMTMYAKFGVKWIGLHGTFYTNWNSIQKLGDLDVVKWLGHLG